MPGELRVNSLNLNKKESIIKLKRIISKILNRSDFKSLHISKKYYFKLDETISANSGWYMIFNEKEIPIYVGKALNLNNRLNSENGSRDQFANPKRTSDPERNFIKRFSDIGIISKLSVKIIDEKILCEELGLEYPLSNIDRDNIEKFINISRNELIVKHGD